MKRKIVVTQFSASDFATFPLEDSSTQMLKAICNAWEEGAVDEEWLDADKDYEYEDVEKEIVTAMELLDADSEAWANASGMEVTNLDERFRELAELRADEEMEQRYYDSLD